MIKLYKRGRQYYDEEGARYDPDAVKFYPNRFKIVDENRKRLPLRAPVVKSNKLNDEQTRMAGDAILKDLFEEAAEEKRQTQYLAKQLGRFADIDAKFERAGVPHQVVEDLQESRQLNNGVPAPFIDTTSKPGIERRVHTEIKVNPFTGENEIVAFNNPSTNEALVTEFGRNVNMEGQDKASEYVQDHILKLMGFKPERGPKGKVDFYIEQNGKRIGVDGQAIGEGQPAVVEAFTKVMPNNRAGRFKDGGGYGYGYAPNRRNPNGKNTPENVSAIKRDVKKSLKNAMNEGRTFDEAMEFLVRDGYIADDRNIKGKLYKSDYDKVLMPIQNQRQHIQNAQQDRIAIAPEGVVSYNIDEIKDYVKGITNPNDVLAAYNAANDGQGKARVKLRAEVPSEYITDVVANNPYVAQILNKLPYA